MDTDNLTKFSDSELEAEVNGFQTRKTIHGNSKKKSGIANPSDTGNSGYDYLIGPADGSSFSCPLCSECLTSRDTFQVHFLQHQLQNPFKCAVCEAVFPHAIQLSDHIRRHQEDLAVKSVCGISNTRVEEYSFSYREANGFSSNQETNLNARMATEDSSLNSIRIRTSCQEQKPEYKNFSVVNFEEVITDTRDEDDTDSVISGIVDSNGGGNVTKTSTGVTAGMPSQQDFKNESDELACCRKCGRKMRSEYHLQMHSRSCVGGAYKRRNKLPLKKSELKQCDVCRKVCLSGYHLQLHKQKHEKKTAEKRQIFCSTCGKVFLNMSSLKCHSAYVHSTDRKYTCDMCDKTFVRKNTLELHIRTHSDLLPFTCDICAATFRRKDAVLTHKKRKHQDALGELRKKRHFFCGICDAFFPERTHYKVHDVICESNKKVMCELCGKWYVSSGSLREHIRTVHEKVRKFQCDDCGQKFLQRSALNAHRNIHSSEKPFLCDSCGKAFRSKKVLERHKFSHNPVKSFQCDLCKKEFSRREHLTRHTKIHVPDRRPPERKFACQICSRTFTTRRYLRDHESSHYREGDRPFRCEVCGLRFSMEIDLQRHLLEHDGHRDILCADCDKHFKSSDQFHFHLRSAHGRNPDPRIAALVHIRKGRNSRQASTCVEPNFNPLQIQDFAISSKAPKNEQKVNYIFTPLHTKEKIPFPVETVPDVRIVPEEPRSRQKLSQLSLASAAPSNTIPAMTSVYPTSCWAVTHKI